MYVLRNDGEEQWNFYSDEQLSHVAAADFNGNGEQSIIIYDAMGVFRGFNGYGDQIWFYTPTQEYSFPGASMAISDINNDGYLEVVLSVFYIFGQEQSAGIVVFSPFPQFSIVDNAVSVDKPNPHKGDIITISSEILNFLIFK